MGIADHEAVKQELATKGTMEDIKELYKRNSAVREENFKFVDQIKKLKHELDNS